MRIEHDIYIGKLIIGWIRGELNPLEEQELRDWMELSPENADLVKKFSEKEFLQQELNTFLQFDLAKSGNKIKQVLNRESHTHRIHFLRRWGWAAASVILLLTTVAVVWFTKFNNKSPLVVTQPLPVENDILPGRSKAFLTLADGSEIILDSVSNGILAQQLGAKIQKNVNGEIVYLFDRSSLNNTVAYNTMSTPRGGTYQLVLPDGSKVWLNAESSIRFPTVFTAKRREIRMTGEAYFEIKTDKEKPFIVKTISDEIEVLGTKFNVNAYGDMPVKTSLLEGTVKLKNRILKPGQAFINGKIEQTDLDQDIAWKNGMFNLENKTIEQAMKQLARWYDVDIVYDEGRVITKLSGEMDRNLTLRDALLGLNGIGAKFTLIGRTVHVTPLKK